MAEVPVEPTASAEERRRLRAFAMASHPDRGGEPEAFIAGLAALREGRPVEPSEVPTVYRRRRGLAGWLGLGRRRPPSRGLE